MEYVRDYAMYVAVFGLFSFVWFGWAQEKPRASWRKWIGSASGAGLLLCLFGVYLSVTHWDAPSALSIGGAFGRYLLLVYAEIALAGIGAFLLMRKKRSQLVAPWILLVVGVHFVGLQPVFQDASLYLLAGLLISVAAGSVIVAPRLKVAYSAIAGIGAGTVLLAFALLGLARYFAAM